MGCCQMIFFCCKKKDYTPSDPPSSNRYKKKPRNITEPRIVTQNINDPEIVNDNNSHHPVSYPARILNNHHNDQQFEIQFIHVKKTTEAFKINSMFPLSSIIHSGIQKDKEPKLIYNCPICLDYFNTILVSSCCGNYICRICAENYISTTIKYMTLIKCPLCNANENIILSDVDPQQPVKIYVDVNIGRENRKLKDFKSNELCERLSLNTKNLEVVL